MAIIDDAVAAYRETHTIKGVARKLCLSDQKARKLLITAGAIQPGKVAGGAAAPLAWIGKK